MKYNMNTIFDFGLPPFVLRLNLQNADGHQNFSVYIRLLIWSLFILHSKNATLF